MKFRPRDHVLVLAVVLEHKQTILRMSVKNVPPVRLPLATVSVNLAQLVRILVEQVPLSVLLVLQELSQMQS